MDSSLLLRLPSELRNKIYALALTHHSPIILSRTSRSSGPFTYATPIFSSPGPSHIVALPSTCRQLRDECGKMFYALNTFQCNPYPRSLSGPIFQDVLKPWREQIGEANWKVVRDGGCVRFWHWFSDGYLCGSWTPQFRNVVCGIWDYAVRQGLVQGKGRVEMEILLPKEIGVGALIVDLKELEESWKRVLGVLEGKLREESGGQSWKRGVVEQSKQARDYMMSKKAECEEVSI